jgi:hypothetical protein
VDLKQYEPAMRHLIDSYIAAEESEKVSAFDDFSLVELLVKVVKMLENYNAVPVQLSNYQKIQIHHNQIM